IEAAMRILSFNPEMYVDVAGGGTSLGIQKVGEGLVDIGNSGRPLTAAERERYRLVSYPLALDGIAVVVHAANPVSELSRAQIKKIFSGQIHNWREVGGADAPIVRYGREKGSATMEVFEGKLLGKEVTPAECNLVSSNSAMRNIVAMDRNGIGYLSIGHLDPAKVKGVTIDGVVPSQQNALNGKYTVSRTLYMNTGKNPSPLALLFIDYLRSTEGAAIIKEAGYFPLR
ncbi:MAG: phosphate ABC transporter substrate-binding protein, partial [Desulfobulbaceae bacterium]|nr:phosphate ABC transporter substrate-binding protein [Desulfobulbaceae bacterium]